MTQNADYVRVSNALLPGYRSRRTLTMGSELHREEVIDGNGEYVGEVVYVGRKTARGTQYGWLPAKAPRQSKLTSKVDAIVRLPRLASTQNDSSGATNA